MGQENSQQRFYTYSPIGGYSFCKTNASRCSFPSLGMSERIEKGYKYPNKAFRIHFLKRLMKDATKIGGLEVAL